MSCDDQLGSGLRHPALDRSWKSARPSSYQPWVVSSLTLGHRQVFNWKSNNAVRPSTGPCPWARGSVGRWSNQRGLRACQLCTL